MATKFYNVPPYYDDFDPAKNYVRVLFRPGYAVQARELTQLQTAISAQIDRFGSHIFKEGSRVLGGEASLDIKYAYVRLESTFTDSGTTYYPEGSQGSPSYYLGSVGRILTGASGVSATVLEILPSTTEDSLTAYVRYNLPSTNTSDQTHPFSAGEILNYTESSGVARKFKVKPAPTTATAVGPTGYGTRVSISEGVWFVSGNFVYTEASAVIVSKYTQNPSARIVYKVNESIVTSAEDATLVDNSLGTPNESAPGAHRYQISLELISQPYALNSRTEDNIIQVLLIIGGQVAGRARTEYAELAKELATRTYEESGNYTVRPFQLSIREYYDDGSNNGLYTVSQIQSALGENTTTEAAIAYGKQRLAIGLEPSVAYVSGYRVETLATSYVPILKSRETGVPISNGTVFAPLGGYCYINTVVGMPDITTYSAINLKNSSGTVIGTARARTIELVSGTTYKLFVFDIQMTSGTFSNVATLQDTVNSFTANVDDIDQSIVESVVYDPANSSLVYKLPVSAVKSLRKSSDPSQTSFIYQVREQFTKNTETDGRIILSVTSAPNDKFFSSSASDYIIVRASDGAVLTANSVTLDPGLTQVTLTTSNTTGNIAFKVIAPVRKTALEKSKTLVQNAQTAIATPNVNQGSYDSLGRADVLRIKSIYMSPAANTDATTSHLNITSRYNLDNGQRENFYDIARIQLKPGAASPTGRLLVIYDYFQHSTGDYFCVNSYSNVDYSDIPAFDSIRGLIQLRDALDFRPTKTSTGIGFVNSGGSTGASLSRTLIPNSIINTDIQYYLPRIDKVFVTKFGEFGSVSGISSINPRPPQDPEDSMVLYTVSLGAYTFGTTDASAKIVENKRYTMRDIGRLEKRLSNVEYYTSLSLLEKEAASAQILDSASNPRYKNGFVVDSFVDHNIGAVTHPDYKCSIDAEKGVLRPDYSQKYVNLVSDLPSSGVANGIKQTGSLITLNYTEVNMIEQPYSSYDDQVNPHAVYRWQGRLTMSPTGDDWKDVDTKPDIAPDALPNYEWYYDVPEEQASQSLFNSWEINWHGATPEDEEQLNALLRSEAITRGTSGSLTASLPGKTFTGTAFPNKGAYSSTQTTQVADAIVDTTTIPYIRSRKVYFRATGLKPNSRVYAFFDGVNVSDYVREEAAMVDYTINPNDTSYANRTSHPDGSSALIANASGEIIGSFIIPNNSTLKFRTGSRVFRLIDNTRNDVDSAFTYAEFTYTAIGLLETRRQSVISVSPPVMVPVPVPGPPALVRPIVSIGVQGRSPKYAGIPFNLNVSTFATGFGTLQDVTVWERSASTISGLAQATWRSNVIIERISGTISGGYSADSVWRISPPQNLPGVYQVQARAVWAGETYYSSGTIDSGLTFTFTANPTPGQVTDASYN